MFNIIYIVRRLANSLPLPTWGFHKHYITSEHSGVPNKYRLNDINSVMQIKYPGNNFKSVLCTKKWNYVDLYCSHVDINY